MPAEDLDSVLERLPDHPSVRGDPPLHYAAGCCRSTGTVALPTAHPEHADRVANADLSYPLHVVLRRQRWLILDGIHRLVKAEMLGLSEIVVATLSPADVAKVARHPVAE